MEMTAVIFAAEEGGFVALNPETGTTTQEVTVEEALANLKEATVLSGAELVRALEKLGFEQERHSGQPCRDASGRQGLSWAAPHLQQVAVIRVVQNQNKRGAEAPLFDLLPKLAQIGGAGTAANLRQFSQRQLFRDFLDFNDLNGVHGALSSAERSICDLKNPRNEPKCELRRIRSQPSPFGKGVAFPLP